MSETVNDDIDMVMQLPTKTVLEYEDVEDPYFVAFKVLGRDKDGKPTAALLTRSVRVTQTLLCYDVLAGEPIIRG